MIAYFDMFSGISGDMVLGAFIDLGVPVDWIEKELSNFLKGFELRSETVFKNSLRAVKLSVDIDDNLLSRNYKDIKILLENSSLPEKVKKNSLLAFEKIAKAESYIHGTDIDRVHFHEIGGIDSIVDIAGTFLSADYLGIQKVYGSKIPLGSGSVDCSHGRIPVPAPATLAILEQVPVTCSDAVTEIVTPTGAAIVSTLASSFGPMPEMTVKSTGYGAGKRETGSGLPNLLRIILGKENRKNPVLKEDIYVIKTNVDDMNPEITGFLMELLLENNVLDVCYVPVQMKKNRPGVQIEVMCREKDLNSAVRLILTQTSSLGVRYYKCERSFLSREKAFVKTSLGRLQVKKIKKPDNSIGFVPEYEACRLAALEKNIPLKDVYNRVLSDTDNPDKIIADKT